ncbi:MAG: GntR family transcriptional regulator [Lachnospiraceae bacterium]|nr:GntR family transcriptional regulator [Lachnospiraceae bacterium]
MNIIINHTSMVPIYEQIVEQIKKMVVSGELKPEDILPSVRTLAKDLKISALTVKKAYDFLEEEGLTVTIHGKGTFVSAMNTEQMLEEQKKEIEGEFEKSIAKGKAYGISAGELKELFELVLED